MTRATKETLPCASICWQDHLSQRHQGDFSADKRPSPWSWGLQAVVMLAPKQEERFCDGACI